MPNADTPMRPGVLTTRANFPDIVDRLREHFEVNRHYVVVAALKALADEGALPVAKVAEAIKKYGIDPNKPDPTTV